MNIALIGYGKMGKEIEKIAISRGHQIKLIVDQYNQKELTLNHLKEADVALEFTNPQSAYANFLKCFEANVPVVSGTTGWLEKFPEIEKQCEKGKALFYASNFSLGVNLFFELNKKLTQLMSSFDEYHVDIEEIHHKHKVDAPSGTALHLVEEIIKNHPEKKKWTGKPNTQNNEIGISAKRRGSIPGTHAVTWHSEIDEIMIQHRAYNRKGFALGAVLAAEFLINKKGMYGMSDLLQL